MYGTTRLVGWRLMWLFALLFVVGMAPDAVAQTELEEEALDPGPSAAWRSPAPSDTAECVPACRPGYVCHEGQCVSLCNPPCATGEVCTAEGACVLAAAPPAAAAPPIATAAEPLPAPPLPVAEPASDVSSPPDLASESDGWRRKGWAFVPRLGFRVVGDGTSKIECSGIASGASGCGSEEDYDDATLAVLAFDALGHVSRGVRLGAGLWMVPSSVVEVDGEDYKLGWETSLYGIFEGVIAVSPSSAIVLRFQAGLLLLMAGGDLKDDIEETRRACSGTEGLSCRTHGGPFTGFTYGAGVGFVSGDEKLRWRIDIVSQLYSLKVEDVELTTAAGSGNISNQASGSRGWLMGGLEF